ncbi:AB hydrolase superfamily protein YdjP [Aquisalinus flavus]|uniref:AB hydrolase superfamily protein YdjP n=1 Tax=Aquisalinus flavus TaxID=1526572 RepID=A0A8J2V7D9_9PROT|nr:alpha/beta hydrolase [Aquisalinus flavus]MBD0428148.1 alpha/beta hydrolase [Aquisalinus flavus]GGD18294.1 AB hydrolase superfamily protein YdjP [Aquisalinus flavus]
MQVHHLHLRDGGRLAWRESGAGAPLLFVHGWSVDGSLFSRQMAALSSTFRVICLDLRGHGLSDAAPQAGVALLADDVQELLTRLGLRNVIAVGWSLGAMVLWHLLSRERLAQISGLVTVDMSPMIHNTPDWQLGLMDGRDYDKATGATTAMTGNWPKMVNQFVPRIFSPEFAQTNPHIVNDVARLAERGDVATLAAIWHSMVDQDFRDDLGRIQVPALVAYGANSQLYHAQTAQFVARALPVSDLVEFTRSGHAPHVEEPDQFNQAIEVFARGVSAQKTMNTKTATP